MALVVLRRYTNLPEAHAAAGALRAAGLHPSVFDETTGSVMPLQQLYLAGYRLGVPEEEAQLAAEVLGAASRPEALEAYEDDEDYEPPRAPPRWTGWWTFVGVLTFIVSVPAGCALVMARRKPTPLRIGVFAVFALISAAFWAALLAPSQRQPVFSEPQYPASAPSPS
jgi:hypothetical protein